MRHLLLAVLLDSLLMLAGFLAVVWAVEILRP